MKSDRNSTTEKSAFFIPCICVKFRSLEIPLYTPFQKQETNWIRKLTIVCLKLYHPYNVPDNYSVRRRVISDDQSRLIGTQFL